MLIAIPVKPFGVAKARLAPVLSASERSALGKYVAGETVSAAIATTHRTAVVTGDDGVAAWAHDIGADVIRETNGTGLEVAARSAVREARHGERSPWAIVHADLPLVSVTDLLAIVEALQQAGVVLAPSYDGGTNVVAGDLDNFGFSYGPGSFQRHVRAAARHPTRILTRRGLVLDLDSPADLTAAADLAGWSSSD